MIHPFGSHKLLCLLVPHESTLVIILPALPVSHQLNWQLHNIALSLLTYPRTGRDFLGGSPTPFCTNLLVRVKLVHTPNFDFLGHSEVPWKFLVGWNRPIINITQLSWELMNNTPDLGSSIHSIISLMNRKQVSRLYWQFIERST